MVVLSIFTQQTLALKSSFSGCSVDGGLNYNSIILYQWVAEKVWLMA